MGDLRAWKLSFEELVPPERASSVTLPGFDPKIAREPVPTSSASRKKDSGMLARKQKAMYARATAPIKNIAMMCFMAWMSGNGIQIFSIIMTFSLLAQPISAIIGSGQVFKKEPEWPQLDVMVPRLLFCLIQFAQLIFGFHKLNNMGLLPLHASDWISTMKVPDTLEHAFAAS